MYEFSRCATLLLGLAILMASLVAAAAENAKWEGNFRQCHIRKWFSKDELADMQGWEREPEGQTIIIAPEDIPS
jgi:hypothetical protein